MINVKKRYLEMAKYHEKVAKKENDIKVKKYHEKLRDLYLSRIDKEDSENDKK